MSVKYIKENYSEAYETIDKEALRWVFKNKNLLREKFSKKFPRSPFRFVAQLKSKRGTLLVNNDAEIRRVDKVAFLNWETLKRLGCQSSL